MKVAGYLLSVLSGYKKVNIIIGLLAESFTSCYNFVSANIMADNMDKNTEIKLA